MQELFVVNESNLMTEGVMALRVPSYTQLYRYTNDTETLILYVLLYGLSLLLLMLRALLKATWFFYSSTCGSTTKIMTITKPEHQCARPLHTFLCFMDKTRVQLKDYIVSQSL